MSTKCRTNCDNCGVELVRGMGDDDVWVFDLTSRHLGSTHGRRDPIGAERDFCSGTCLRQWVNKTFPEAEGGSGVREPRGPRRPSGRASQRAEEESFRDLAKAVQAERDVQRGDPLFQGPPEIGSLWRFPGWTNPEYMGAWRVTEIGVETEEIPAPFGILLEQVDKLRKVTEADLRFWPGGWSKEGD